MKTFIVTVRTESGRYQYLGIALASIDLFAVAYDRFGVCRVSVRPVKD